MIHHFTPENSNSTSPAAKPAIMAAAHRSSRNARTIARAGPRIALRLEAGHVWAWAILLRHGHELENVAVRILEIEAAAAVPVVELGIGKAPWRAAEGQSGSLDAIKDRVELRVADVERIVMAVERLHVIVEQERQGIVHLHRCEMTVGTREGEPEHLREKARGGLFIAGRHDRVVERDRHRASPRQHSRSRYSTAAVASRQAPRQPRPDLGRRKAGQR